MQQIADKHWDEQDGYFHLGGGGSEPMSNSMQLLTYSVAAMQGHEGPARNDHRARILAARLVSSPPFVTSKTGGGQIHAPGWVNSMTAKNGGQHLVFDAEVVDGLTYAYRARDALQLPDTTVKAIRDAIHTTARRQAQADPRRDPPHRPRRLLALPDDSAQPDQLVRADVLRRRAGDRRQHALEARLLPAAGSVLQRRPRQRVEPPQLRRRHALPLPARAHDQRLRQPGLRRVREHRADLHALLQRVATRGP